MYGVCMVERDYWTRCPICHGPLEEVYYGGGVTKRECNRCVKHFVTEIYNEKE
jgi:hypothetical protein